MPVCLAVWLRYGTRSTGDKILPILCPFLLYVTAGFEHSVANMYFVPLGMMLEEMVPESLLQEQAIAAIAAQISSGGFVRCPIAVTLGNTVGGGVLVGAVYWFIYLRGTPRNGRTGSR